MSHPSIQEVYLGKQSVYIYIYIYILIVKYTHLVDLEPMTLASIPLLWEEKVPAEL